MILAPEGRGEEAMKLSGNDWYLPRWPKNADIRLGRGLTLTFGLLVLLRLWEICLAYVTGIGFSIHSVGPMVIRVCIDLSKLFLVYISVRIWCQITFRDLLFFHPPTWIQILKWGLIGILLNILDSLPEMRYASYFIYPTFAPFLTLRFISSVVIVPLIEEILFRGIFYVAIRKLGREYAYIFSTLLFLIWHISFVSLFTQGTTGLTFLHVVSIVICGAVTAHIYESTGKLLLCVVFHSAGNAIVVGAPVIGYLLHL